MENNTTNTELHPSIYTAPERGYYDIKDSVFLGNVEAFAEDLTGKQLSLYYKDMVDNTIETFWKERMKRRYTGKAVDYVFTSKEESEMSELFYEAIGVSMAAHRYHCRKEKNLIVELCDDLKKMWPKVWMHLIPYFVKRGVNEPVWARPVTTEYVLYKLVQLSQ